MPICRHYVTQGAHRCGPIGRSDTFLKVRLCQYSFPFGSVCPLIFSSQFRFCCTHQSSFRKSLTRGQNYCPGAFLISLVEYCRRRFGQSSRSSGAVFIAADTPRSGKFLEIASSHWLNTTPLAVRTRDGLVVFLCGPCSARKFKNNKVKYVLPSPTVSTSYVCKLFGFCAASGFSEELGTSPYVFCNMNTAPVI